MKKRNSFIISVFAMFIACQFLSPAAAMGQDVVFQYAAKFVCGENSAGIDRILPGQYATAINIHNPFIIPVTFNKRIALTFPPAAQSAGQLSDIIPDKLEPLEALEVDCEEIPSEFFAPLRTPYTKGFLIIESQFPLDVTAVYTAGSINESGVSIVSIDVEQIPERKVGKKFKFPSTGKPPPLK